VWLTIHVRKGTPPGIYTGKINIEPQNKPTSQIKLVVKVLPFELPDRVENRYYCILCWHMPSPAMGNVWKQYKRILEDLKAHGMETLFIGAGFVPKVKLKGGEVKIVDMGNLKRAVMLYQKFGFSENRILWNTAWGLTGLAKKLAGNNRQ